MSIVEKVKVALYFEIAGLLVSIVGAVMDLGTFMLYFQPALFAASFFIGVPIAVCMGKVLRSSVCRVRDGESPGRGKSAAWGILSVLYVLNLSLAPVILIFIYQLT